MTDKAYEAARNALIPEAELYATRSLEHLRITLNEHDYQALWSEQFHRRMNQLVKLRLYGRRGR